MRDWMHVLFAALMALAMPAVAQQAWPARAIRIIVPFPAGGAPDLIARPLAARLSEQLGQPVIIDNKVGAGGRIGATELLNAPPDGYTVMLHGSPLTIDPSVHLAAKWDVAKDFEGIGRIGEIPNAIVVAGNSRFKTLAEFLSAARAEPGVYNFSSIGNTTVTHLAIDMLQQASKVKLTPVFYPGNPAAQLALLRGDIQLMSTSVALVNRTGQANTPRPLAVTSVRRSRMFPDVPTVAELGYPGYEATTWYALFAPRRTPPDVVARLGKELAAAVQNPQVQKSLVDLGMDIEVLSGPPFKAFLEQEQRRWAEVLQAAGIKPQ